LLDPFVTAASAALDAATGVLSGRRQLLVLTYHRVLATPDPLLPDEVDAARFEWHIRFLAEHFSMLKLGEAVERLHAASLPQRSVCITLDDGYASNYEIALPILKRYGACATCFVATGYMDGGIMWNDTVIEAVRRSALSELDLRSLGLGHYPLNSAEARRRAIDGILAAVKYLSQAERAERVRAITELAGSDLRSLGLMMSAEQIRNLHGSEVEIGAHTVSHPILARLEDAAASQEIRQSRLDLEELVRAPIRSFAYPNGKPGLDYERTHVDMVREAGFAAAVSTAWGPARSTGDRWQVPRLAPWDRSPLRFGLRLLRTYLQRQIEFA
jgi:peptidoglycan/xylan/chitin deacetylase (PgdA/CDA1 family)